MLCMYCMKDMEQTAQVCPHCGNSKSYSVPAHRLAPGTMLAHRYIVGVAKGEGGFGITYAGKDTRLDRIVAIKEYFPGAMATRTGTPLSSYSLNFQPERLVSSLSNLTEMPSAFSCCTSVSALAAICSRCSSVL